MSERFDELRAATKTLAAPEGVVEWVKGSLLTDYEKRMPADLYQRYLARYRERLLGELGQKAPYFYAFKRVLARGRKDA